MADVFDRIHQGGGDVFDKIHAAGPPKPPEQPGAVKRFLGGLYDSTVGPAVQAVTHPRETILNTVGATVDAVQHPGQTLSRLASGLMVPVPEEIVKGDMAAAAGKAVGTVASAVGPGALKESAPSIVPAVERGARAVKAGVAAAAPDVAAGVGKAAVGMAAAEMLPGGPIKYALGAAPTYSGARQIGRGLSKGAKAFREKLAAATEKLAASEPAPAVTPGEAFAKSQGIDYASLSADEQTMLEHAARIQANSAEQAAARPVGPRQPEAPAPAAEPVQPAAAPAPSRSLADELRAELEAKRAAQQQPPPEAPAPAPPVKRKPPQRLPEGFIRGGTLDPAQGNWTGAGQIPRTAADYAPRPAAVEAPAPKVAPPEAPPPPRTEVIQPTQPAVPAAVEPVAPTVAPATLNPVEIGRRIMRSMGMEDVPAKDALQTFQNLQELSARTGKPIEELFQKYTGEPLAGGVQAPAAPKEPRPLTPKQGEAAMFRTKEMQAEVNPNLKPEDARSFYTESGEKVSKPLRAEQKKVFNADAKAKRFADAFHAEGVTSEDVANMTAADAKAMTDGLIAKGLLKKGEMPPNSSLPRLIGHLKALEKQAKQSKAAR